MISRIFSIRSLALVATLVGGAAFSASSAEAHGCNAGPRVVYVPVQPVYVQQVRRPVVYYPAPVYRPSCH
ncbi:MAG: hypothetical protein ACKOSQ_05770 [Planctomycetaceae bacterium]